MPPEQNLKQGCSLQYLGCLLLAAAIVCPILYILVMMVIRGG